MMLTDKQFEFPGKYDDMARFLSKKANAINPNGINIFNRILDCMLMSAAVGIRRDLCVSVKNLTFKHNGVSVFPEQFNSVLSTIRYLYSIAMLSYDKDLETGASIPLEVRIERAFRVPYANANTEEEKAEEQLCMNIFRGYVFGGLEYIYDFFEKRVELGSPNYEVYRELALMIFVRENLDLPNQEFI